MHLFQETSICSYICPFSIFLGYVFFLLFSIATIDYRRLGHDFCWWFDVFSVFHPIGVSDSRWLMYKAQPPTTLELFRTLQSLNLDAAETWHKKVLEVGCFSNLSQTTSKQNYFRYKIFCHVGFICLEAAFAYLRMCFHVSSCEHFLLIWATQMFLRFEVSTLPKLV